MNVTLRDHRLDDAGAEPSGLHRLRRAPVLPTARRLRSVPRRRAGASIAAPSAAASRQALAKTSLYPRMSPGNGMRGDAWPKDGGPPGSDLGLMREQLLDPFDVRYGLLPPLVGGAATSATWNSAPPWPRRQRMAMRRLSATRNRG